MKHMTFFVSKGVQHHVLIPLEPGAIEFLEGCANGEVVECSTRKPRNPAFHRKAFALLNVAFAYWNPECDMPGQKDFDAFRRQITILAGFYKTVYRVNGDFELVADSISFANMDESRFQQWYSAVLDVVLSHIMTDVSQKDVERAVDNIVGFA